MHYYFFQLKRGINQKPCFKGLCFLVYNHIVVILIALNVAYSVIFNGSLT